MANTIVTLLELPLRTFVACGRGRKPSSICPSNFLRSLQAKTKSIRRIRPCGAIPSAALNQESLSKKRGLELATYQKALHRSIHSPQLQDRYQARNAYLWVSSARTGLPTFFGRVYSTPLYLMQGLVGIVLLLCCVNVAGLMMSKVYSRRQEFAVRTAIGAARWRLIRQYLTESFVIALAGAALGAAAAWYGTGYLLPFFRHPE